MANSIIIYDKQMNKSSYFLNTDKILHKYDPIILDMAYSHSEKMVNNKSNLYRLEL